MQDGAHRVRRRPRRLQHRVQGEAVHERVDLLDRELGIGKPERNQSVADELPQRLADARAADAEARARVDEALAEERRAATELGAS